MKRKTEKTEKAKKTARKADAENKKTVITDKTTVYLLKKREKSGKKTALLNMVPKKGILVKKLTALAKEEEGIPSSKVSKWLPFLLKYGYIRAD